MADLDLAAVYLAVRDRMRPVFEAMPAADAERIVPSCPDWTVHDLLAHQTSMPTAIIAGDLPSGDANDWIQGLVDARRDTTVEELLTEWRTDDAALGGLVANVGLLVGDLVVHEGDLAGALGIAADRTAPESEAMLPGALAGLKAPITEAGLGAIEVRHGDRRWRTHDAAPGWSFEADPWEALRALTSRRTADELRAAPHTGGIEPYVAILDAHLPLPTATLGER
ncbi:MAG TPA: maleylpyruvate isomerase N-terminal domain-containing protein [Acidimicrobiia bacterium]|nr:maleylpyruvate isomerase N-terminal domain-containing protein [Acidimicrobiia bacterium]